LSVENLIFQEAVAVFLRADNGSFLMQLRDDKLSIVFPDHWGLFGGTIESGESVCEAASRELEEEIELHVLPKEIVKFRRYSRSNYRVHACFYHLKTPISKLNLQEGSDLGLFSINEILTGRLLSQKFNAYFPVADPLIGFFRDFSNIDKQAAFLRLTS
jgi:8-oxo-dGTP diphosphatase